MKNYYPKLLIGFTIIVLFNLPAAMKAQQAGSQFKQQINGSFQLQYLVYLPQNYQPQGNEKYPMLLFLHGSGERGDSIELVKAWGPPKIAEEKGLPFIVVSPQCPKGVWWNALLLPLRELLNQTIQNYNVDTSHIYLTGMSMGGFGTFALAQAYPDYFAAIAPVCGGGTPGMVKFIKNVPTWVFHGQDDDVVLPINSILMVDALKEAGAEVKFTLYPGVNHGSWIPAYNDSGIFDWFLEHRKQ
ncbi:MAG: prolyl oligopeptidase family serine peptidase [Salinivirgaceae bacterium]|nr:prolyl oligopeptidase family serine peptidase [Salinivirgaceae bacterium]